MAAEIGSIVAEKAIDSLFGHIQREFGYLFCFNNNFQELETRLGELIPMRNDVQGREDEAKRMWQTLGETVRKWIEDANGKITEAENVINDKAELQKGCFSIKWCPNLKLRFSLGRKGKKLSKDLNDLLQSGKHHLTQTGLALPPPTINLSNYIGDASDFQSRKDNMDKIIEMLGDKETRLIGIHGMPGIGKTIFSMQLLQKVQDFHNNLFEFLVISTVSSNPNYNAIQQQVVEMLGGSSIKELESEIKRADLVRRAFYNKKVVVLLDDVWREFDLNAKGFPLRESDCCKIIYTSRNQGLWSGERTFRKKEISLDVLSSAEARNLFIRKVNLRDDDNDFDWKNEKAKEIVDECKGLPLALEVVGGALIEKKTYHWNDMLSRMKDHHEHLDTIQKVLRTSYDFLEEDNAKSLFLICCLFREDENIPIETLRRCAAGLHLIKDRSDQREIRDSVYASIDNLKTKSLLIEGQYLGGIERAVKMHDVVRDVGIWIGKNDEKFQSKLELLQLDASDNSDVRKPDNLKVLLIVPNSIRDFSYFSSFSYPPNLKMLSLENLDMRRNVPSIRHLKCLEILSFRGSKMEDLPNEISELTNLRLLDLTENKCFISYGILSKLTNLQELYMCDSFVLWRVREENNASAELFELDCLPKLWRLELEISNIEQVGRGNNLFSSSKLKEFKIRMRKETLRNFERGKNQLQLENVNDNFLYELEVILQNEVTHLHLRNTSVTWEQIHLKGFLKDIVHIELEQYLSIITLFPHSKSSPQTYDIEEINGLDLRRIKLYECNQIQHLFPISISRHLVNLQVLVVQKCQVIEEVVCKNTEELTIIEFNALETLELHELCMLECFCKGINEIHFHKLKSLELKGLEQFIFPEKFEIPCLEKLVIGFIPNLENLGNFLPPSSLKEVTIYNCDRLRYVFSHNFPKKSILHLQYLNLQYLSIRECKMLRGIVFVSLGEEEKWGNISFDFPNLSTLHLESLDELASFVISNEEKTGSALFDPNQVLFHCLNELIIRGLPNINYIGEMFLQRDRRDSFP